VVPHARPPVVAGAEPASPGPTIGRRSVLAGPVVAVVTLVAALVATDRAGVPLRDPGHVTAARLGVALALVAAFAALDVAVRAFRRTAGPGLSLAALRDVRRERWTVRRIGIVVVALVSFFITYLAYRNLKSVVPLLRPGELFDRQLLAFDRTVSGGDDPAVLLHRLLGTGAAHVLSDVYMAFFAFIPLALAVALALCSDLRAGLFFSTALSITWALGAVSYFLLPSIGPFHADPAAFATLPSTPVRDLQDTLVDQRAAFIGDPLAPGAAQSIGAFASLHTAILCTGALGARLLGLPRLVRVAVWTMTALTVVATVYFGWHYLLDDVAGFIIAVTALGLAGSLSGFDLGVARRMRRTSAPVPEPA
jgi:hypothetical protein